MKYLLPYITFLACSISALHLPFTRQNRLKPGSILKRQSGSVGLSNLGNTLYSSVVKVGGNDVPLSVDTGSTDLWLYDYQQGLLANAHIYPNLPATLRFGQGAVSGNIAQIDVGLANFNVANQSFLYVQQQQDMSIIESKLAAGLLGLGFDSISNINGIVQRNFPGATWGRSLLSNIFLSDLSMPNHIAFRLDRQYDSNDTDKGSFDIGTFAPGLEAVNNTAKIPIFTTRPDQNIYWTVLVDGIAINGVNQTLQTTITNGTIPPSGKLPAVLDTGFSLPQIPQKIAAAIYEPMGGVFDQGSGQYIVPCEAQASLIFYIGGYTIPIHPLDLSLVEVATFNGQNRTVCYGAFQPWQSQAGGGLVDLILGDSFLRNTYTVYDFGDFVEGTSGAVRQDPYVKLLPLTDPGAASIEFQTARRAQLAGLPPQINGSAAALSIL